jgi:hypothetical protein
MRIRIWRGFVSSVNGRLGELRLALHDLMDRVPGSVSHRLRSVATCRFEQYDNIQGVWRSKSRRNLGKELASWITFSDPYIFLFLIDSSKSP